MATTFDPPLSGAILNVLVDVLDLRQWDARGALTSRNARRYLAGDRVSPEAQGEVHLAIGAAVVSSELVPTRLALSDLLPLPASTSLPSLRDVPAEGFIQVVVAQYAERWDALAGALRRGTAPVEFPNHAAGACLRLVTVDVAVRITALLWLLRVDDIVPLSDFWTTASDMRTWLRGLVTSSGRTRDQIATLVRVPPTTLDSWLDDDVKPSFENMQDLAQALDDRGLGERASLMRRLRLAFAARDIFRRIEALLGSAQALGICQRIVAYTNALSKFIRASTKPQEESDFKMRVALATGTLLADQGAKWITAMVTHLWRTEHNPVWRTTLTAATGSWFAHLQDIAAKLGPVDQEQLAIVLGRVPTPADLDALAYRVQASKEELLREPGVADAALCQLAAGGATAALELRLQAAETSGRGDLLGAIELLQEAVIQDPTDAESHFRLGCKLWQVGDIAAGLVELEIAAQLSPTWDRPRVEIAIVLMNEGHDDAAFEKLTMAKAELPSPSTWVLLHLAYASERLERVGLAIANYEELLAIDPDHAEALDRVAHLHFRIGDKRAGADRAKRAAHLGIATVFHAWEEGLYAKAAPRERPAHARALVGLLQFPDSAWAMRERR